MADYKPVYQELVSQRCIDLYKEYLKSDSSSSKANLYILFTSIVSKYKANEHFQKRINITSFEDGAEDMIIEEDEEMLLFKDDKESELSKFIKYVIKEEVAREIEIPAEENQVNIHPTTYGTCR